MSKFIFNRRKFLSGAALIGIAGTIGTAGSVLVSSCENSVTHPSNPLKRLQTWRIPVLADMAVDGKEIKVGLIGCGGQGTGDVINLTKAANGIKITALGDIFKDKIDLSRRIIKEETGQEVHENKCFTGFDAFQKVLDSDIDLILLATPPVFRPIHFETAIRAGKHVFMEKPLCVDVAGALKMLALSRLADSQKICVITGTQRRHHRGTVEAFKLVAQGMIGEITGGNVYYNQGMLWHRDREKNWSDMEWMLRDWVNWCWLSGDHIVEQHIHNLDVFNWFSGLTPVAGLGMGARQRRLTGDQYDMFSIDYEYEGGVHMHSMCRQIDGCSNKSSEIIQGTLGSCEMSFYSQKIKDLSGKVIWEWDTDKEKKQYKQTDSIVLQFVDLITAIRTGEHVNQTTDTVNSSLLAIMGRQSAYTGKRITWEDIKHTHMDFIPKKLHLGAMDMASYKVPIPGIEQKKS